MGKHPGFQEIRLTRLNRAGWKNSQFRPIAWWRTANIGQEVWRLRFYGRKWGYLVFRHGPGWRSQSVWEDSGWGADRHIWLINYISQRETILS